MSWRALELSEHRSGFAVQLLPGLQITGIVRCDQPVTTDLKARNARHVETVGADVMDEVLAQLTTLFE